MPQHVIDVHHLTHTCAGDPEPHVVETWRSVVDTSGTGTCRAPQQLIAAAGVEWVDCGRVLAADRRCVACTVVITTRYEFWTDLGPELACNERVPAGLLPQPCPTCGLPVAALFADTGRHLLCPDSLTNPTASCRPVASAPLPRSDRNTWRDRVWTCPACGQRTGLLVCVTCEPSQPRSLASAVPARRAA